MNWIETSNQGFTVTTNENYTTEYRNPPINLDLILNIEIGKTENETFPIYTIHFRTVNKDKNKAWFFKDESERNDIVERIFDIIKPKMI